MARGFKIALDLEVVQALQEITKRQANDVFQFIESLALNPTQTGDCWEKDATDRRVEIKIVGKMKVTFWTDYPVEEVKIVRIRKI